MCVLIPRPAVKTCGSTQNFLQCFVSNYQTEISATPSPYQDVSQPRTRCPAYCVHVLDAPLRPPNNPDGGPYTIMDKDKAIINKDEMDDEGHSQILVNLCPVLVFPSQASLDRVSDFRISTVKCHSGRFITPSTFQPLSQFLLR